MSSSLVSLSKGPKKNRSTDQLGRSRPTKSRTEDAAAAIKKKNKLKKRAAKLKKDKEDKRLKEFYENHPERASKIDPHAEPLTIEQEQERLEIKESSIPESGRGVFAKKVFAINDIVCEFIGKHCKREETYKQMMYAIEFTGDSGNSILIDGWGFPNAGAMANDAHGLMRVPNLTNNCEFTHFGERMFIVATRHINIGEEILVQYGHEYWQLPEHIYDKVNTSSDLIQYDVDTLHAELEAEANEEKSPATKSESSQKD